MNAIVGQKSNIAPIDGDALIVKAIESQVPVETMERLLAMREKLQAQQAKSEYFSALAKFQSECPVIKKEREVKDKNGRVRYCYAPLDDIIRQVAPHLEANGFSWSIKVEPVEGGVVGTTELHHIGGHSESSSFPVPIEKDAFMNDAQKAGSANTYAKRISFCNVTGILTSDQDDDGASLGSGVDLKDIYRSVSFLVAAVLENAETIRTIKAGIKDGDLFRAAEAWQELTNDEKQSIWVAPSKGGPFTTEERKVISSTEFRKAAGVEDSENE